MKKATERKLIIGVRSIEDMGKDFVSAWKQARSGVAIDVTPHLYFENIIDMWKKLTPRRMELVCFLRKQGNMSIRQLAKALSRDYKDVHSDVQALLPIDLLQKDDAGRVSAPWDSIVINLSDTAVA